MDAQYNRYTVFVLTFKMSTNLLFTDEVIKECYLPIGILELSIR